VERLEFGMFEPYPLKLEIVNAGVRDCYHSQSGIITQQQLRTSPVDAKITTLAILFLEFHKSEIRFPILSRSVGCGAWFKFILLFHPY
jgi:hypothetical protein